MKLDEKSLAAKRMVDRLASVSTDAMEERQRMAYCSAQNVSFAWSLRPNLRAPEKPRLTFWQRVKKVLAILMGNK